MDRKRFDLLTRLLASSGSRRATFGAFLGVSLLGKHLEALAGKRTDKADRDSRDVQGEGRRGAAHRAHHRRKKTQRRRDQRDNQQGNGQNGKRCCGTAQCAPPEPGSTRADCDFQSQSFAGQDLHGTTFRGSDGRYANFNATDNRGSDFSAACLFRATFRAAKLENANWNDACLFAVDFTAAEVGSPSSLEAAVLCGTIMPDGARNDRDCANLPRCCQPAQGGNGGEATACGSCDAADQCHTAGECVCSCTNPTAANGKSCNDGNPLCLAGVCCGEGHIAINGICFKTSDPAGAGCDQQSCDGFIRDCGPFAEDCPTRVCVRSTTTTCLSHADCAPGEACAQGNPGQCYLPC